MLHTPRRRFGLQFAVLARRWRAFLDQALAKAGLTDATWGPLVHLDGSGDGVLQKALAARIGIDDSTLVRLIDILEARGLVERRVNPADRRARRLFLTDAGRRTVSDITHALTAAEDAMLVEVSDAEIDAALTLLHKIRRNLDDLNGASGQDA